MWGLPEQLPARGSAGRQLRGLRWRRFWESFNTLDREPVLSYTSTKTDVPAGRYFNISRPAKYGPSAAISTLGNIRPKGGSRRSDCRGLCRFFNRPMIRL